MRSLSFFACLLSYGSAFVVSSSRRQSHTPFCGPTTSALVFRDPLSIFNRWSLQRRALPRESNDFISDSCEKSNQNEIINLPFDGNHDGDRPSWKDPVKMTSTIETFSKSAARWMQAEINYYEESTGYVPMIISNRRGNVPPITHLERAYEEFVRRFTVDEEDPDNEENEYDITTVNFYHSPFLLVANNVKDDWNVPKSFENKHAARFMLVRSTTKDSSTLFIKCLSGSIHGDLDGESFADTDNWIVDNGLRFIFTRCNSGGDSYQPDRALRPVEPDRLDPRRDADDNRLGNPYPRLFIEIEHKNESGRGMREVGLLAFANPYTRLFLAIKLWPKNKAGEFAAVAVLWGKSEDDKITVRKALDFGTSRVAAVARNGFTEHQDGIMLPPVQEWTRPAPSSVYSCLRLELESLTCSRVALAMDPDWCLVLQAKDLLYRVSSDESTDEYPYIVDARSIPDCRINLKGLVWQANKIKGL